MNEDQAKRAVDIMLVEYNSLRAELLQRIATRFQFLTVPLAVLTLTAAVLGAASDKRPPQWLVVLITVGLCLLVAASVSAFLHIGRMIALLSSRVAEIEVRVDQVMMQQGLGSGYLTWESARQGNRTWWGRRLTGPGTPPPST